MRTRVLLSAGIVAVLGVLSQAVPGDAQDKTPPASAAPAAAAPTAAPAAPVDPNFVVFHHRCGGCHSIIPSEGDGNGPNLATIMGRKAGTMPGFEYSQAMRDNDIVWTPETITQFISGPGQYILFNKMAVTWKGIPKEEIPLAVAYLVSKLGTGPAPAAGAAAPAAATPPTPAPTPEPAK